MAGIRRAVISVWDKTGVVEFARGLAEFGVELLSTGGTARALREAGLDVVDISEFTGFPEMLDGRVKTLHPKVHAGILHRRDLPEHARAMEEHGLESIDLVCVNLYPFEATVAREGVTFEEAIEQIDIGGPTMIRSAAKNMQDVTVVVDPADYEAVLASMREHGGTTTGTLRRRLGLKVFARAAAYNAAIASWLAEQLGEDDILVRSMTGGQKLRYGENAHQSAVLFRNPAPKEACIASADVLHGKAMSYNNYVDGDAALESVRELVGRPGASIIKHTNPCGYAVGHTLEEAVEAAWAGDPVSAFGSVIAVTQPVDLATAQRLKGRFVEALIAPDFEPEALEFLIEKSRSIRLLKLAAPLTAAAPRKMLKQIHGGLLVQDEDVETAADWKVVTRAGFPDEQRQLAEFGLRACKHTKSNAIVLVEAVRPGCMAVLGMGAGQPNRVDALRKLAATKAAENLRLRHPEWSDAATAAHLGACVLISDAFFPFADSIEEAADVGAKFIVQPGGSVRDEEVIAACDERGIAMAFTGMRHFRH